MLKEEVVDLAGTLKQCGQIMDVQARAAGVALTVEAPPRLPGLRADPTRLKQILLNLLSNAVKFTPAGGKVWLGARLDPEGGGLVIEVRDTGVGMKREEIPRAMQPFVQLEHKTPRGDAGTGLGLALVKTLVEAHGGTFSLDSECGKGTTATVRLPSERLAPAVRIPVDPRKVA